MIPLHKSERFAKFITRIAHGDEICALLCLMAFGLLVARMCMK